MLSQDERWNRSVRYCRKHQNYYEVVASCQLCGLDLLTNRESDSSEKLPECPYCHESSLMWNPASGHLECGNTRSGKHIDLSRQLSTHSLTYELCQYCEKPRFLRRDVCQVCHRNSSSSVLLPAKAWRSSYQDKFCPNCHRQTYFDGNECQVCHKALGSTHSPESKPGKTRKRPGSPYTDRYCPNCERKTYFDGDECQVCHQATRSPD